MLAARLYGVLPTVEAILVMREARGKHMTSAIDDVQVVDIERDHAFKRFDQVCQRELHMSGDDFVEHYLAGKFRGIDIDSVPGLSKVLSILPFAGI